MKPGDTMLTIIKKFLAPPVFPDDENKTRSAAQINIIVVVSSLLLFCLIVARILSGVSPLDTSSIILLTVIVVMMVVWAVMRSGAVQLAGYITVAVIWLASTLLAFDGSGLRGTGFVSYFVIMLLAGLLVGVRAATGIAILSILSGFALAYAETAGITVFTPDPPFTVAFEFTFIFIISALIIKLIIDSLQHALDAAKATATNLAASNEELADLRDALELRIQERTSSLEKRATQLQIVASVARTIATMQDLNTLLISTTKLVTEQFGYYHAGIFLVDAANENAVLQAANSEGGIRMLNRQHQLPVDSNSIVGYVTSRGEARIALDVGADAVYFNNPDLRETRSEMALPLRIGSRVIGALDVQSTETNAFSHEDISVLSTLADQIAIAIENARLLSETQTALSEAQSTFEKYVKQEWNSFTQQTRHNAFVFDGKQVLPMDERIRIERTKSIQTGRLSLQKQSPNVSIPIKLRGQTIGVLDVHSKKGNHEWTDDDITLLEAAAERAALALENARLVESAQRRAARERSIGEISAKIGTAGDINAILRATVEEMGRRIGATEVIFEIDSGSGNGKGGD